LTYYSETQIEQNNRKKVLNWLENQTQIIDKEPTLVNNIIDNSQCAFKAAEHDSEQGKS